MIRRLDDFKIRTFDLPERAQLAVVPERVVRSGNIPVRAVVGDDYSVFLLLAIRFAEFECTGKRETSIFHALFAGNGRAPLRLAPIPRSGTKDRFWEAETFLLCIAARREKPESPESNVIKPKAKNKLEKKRNILYLNIALKTFLRF